MPKIVPNYRDEVRTKIIQTAWEVLLEKGALESTMDDFAKALNCSKGALYNYFRNKEELLEQTICSKKIEFEEQLFARFSEGDFLENAGAYFDSEILSSAGTFPALMEIYLEGSRNEKIRDAVHQKYNNIVESIAKLLGELSALNRIVLRTDVSTAAKFIYSVRVGVLFSLFAGLDRKDARRIWIEGHRSIIAEPPAQREKL